MYNNLMMLFLNKGLSYKVFEIYESMEKIDFLLDGLIYELIILSLVKFGRFDVVFKFF